jgi:signal transduction histidine kinase/CheY-like chemotaxis protein/HPt (histidine-containing phosphotransfer) domain-containing protein
MPKSKNFKIGIHGCTGVVALILFVGGLSLFSADRLLKVASWVTHTVEVKGHLRSLEVILQEIETTTRGYQMTRNATFFTSYQEALKRAAVEAEILTRLTSDNLLQQQRLEEINRLLSDQYFLRSDYFNSFLGSANLHKEVGSTSSMQAQINEMKKEEDSLLSLRIEKSKLVARTNSTLIISGVLLGIFFVFYSSRRLEQELRLRNQIEGKLKQDREELTRLKEQAIELAEVKARFLANMSHEIRTPINGIMGIAQLLAHEEELTDHQQTYVNTLLKSSKALLVLVTSILDYSKIEANCIELEAVDFEIMQLLDEIQANFQKEMRDKSISFKITFSEKTQNHYKGDYARLRQILLNLVGNAVKFTKSGEIAIHVSNENADVKFEVRDTGIGIHPENHHRLFKAFNQADCSTTRQYGGSGLGLAICDQLVRLLSGKIGFTSQPGMGSLFWFSVPLVPISNTISSMDQLPIVSPVKNDIHKGILIVEDDLTNQIVLTSLVQNLGYQVDIAHNGKDALRAIYYKNYDLILLDCHMPEMDGFQASKEIRKFNQQVPIIAVSAQFDPSIKIQCLSVGMNDYLSKPIIADELDKVIKNWLQLTSIDSVHEGRMLDTRTLHRLGGFQVSNDNIVARVIESFCQSAPHRVSAIKMGLQNQNYEQVWRSAHSLAGSSANLGAISLSSICEKIERTTKYGKTESLDQDLAELESSLNNTIQELNHYLRDAHGTTLTH